jgi:hypothetical protein
MNYKYNNIFTTVNFEHGEPCHTIFNIRRINVNQYIISKANRGVII